MLPVFFINHEPLNIIFSFKLTDISVILIHKQMLVKCDYLAIPNGYYPYNFIEIQFF